MVKCHVHDRVCLFSIYWIAASYMHPNTILGLLISRLSKERRNRYISFTQHQFKLVYMSSSITSDFHQPILPRSKGSGSPKGCAVVTPSFLVVNAASSIHSSSTVIGPCNIVPVGGLLLHCLYMGVKALPP